MKVCTTCGSEVAGNVDVCSVCGTPLFARASSPSSGRSAPGPSVRTPDASAVRSPLSSVRGAPHGGHRFEAGHEATEMVVEPPSYASSSKIPSGFGNDFGEEDEEEPTMAMQGLSGLELPLPSAMQSVHSPLSSRAKAAPPAQEFDVEDDADPTMMMDPSDQSAFLKAAQQLAAQRDAAAAAAVVEPIATAPEPFTTTMPPQKVNVSSLIEDALGGMQDASKPLDLGGPRPAGESAPLAIGGGSSSLDVDSFDLGVVPPMPPATAAPAKKGGGKGIVVALVVVVLLVGLAVGAWFLLPALGVALPF